MENKHLRIIASVILLSCIGGISSCNKDEAPAKPAISFSTDTKTVSEGVGPISVKVKLDKEAPKDITINYSLDGTAKDLNAAGSAVNADYEIVGNAGQIDIPKGASEGTIDIKIYDDNVWEENETIIIKLDDVDNNGGTISDQNQIVITISNDDDKINVSMAVSQLTYNEDDGVDENLDLVEYDIVFNLDAPAPVNMVVSYSLSGTATDSVSAFNDQTSYDYFIDGVSGQAQVTKGSSNGKIHLKFFPDFHVEDTETIVITLLDAGGLQPTENNKTTIALTQDDGLLIDLSWPASNADLDLIWWQTPALSADSLVDYSTYQNDQQHTFEEIFWPSILIPDGNYGLTFAYRAGTVASLQLTSTLLEVVNGQFEPANERDVRTGTYTLQNQHDWTKESNPAFQIEQTFSIANGKVTNVSDITVPSSGSRVKSVSINSQRLKNKKTLLQMLKLK
jgi:hypothetical protein